MQTTGIFASFGYTISMSKRFELIKNAGFDSVMIWWGDGENEFGCLKNSYKSLSEKYGLPITNAHLPFDNANDLWLNCTVGDEYTEFICQQITECSYFNIPTVVMHLTKGQNVSPYSDLGLNRMNKIIDTAEKCNVNLALENLRKVEYLDFVFNNIKSEKMGICFDSGHNNYFTLERDILSDYKDHLFALHLNDNMGDDDIHMLPFDGTVNWGRLAGTLKEIRYNGVLSLEVVQDRHINYQDMSVEEYLFRAYECLIRLQKQLDNKYKTKV